VQLASKLSGTIVSSQAGTTQSFPSLDGVVSFAGNYMAVRIVHAPSVVYIIGTIGTSNPPSDFADFASSVTLTPH